MRMRHVLAVSFVATAVGVAACSGGAGSTCGSYFDTVVARQNQCNATSVTDSSLKSSFESYCDGVSKAPGMSNFAGEIDHCKSLVQSTDCNATATCTITGTLANGAACGIEFQCSGGLCDNANTLVPNSEVKCGKCAGYVAAGGSCAAGSLCDPSTSECVNGTCVAFAQKDQSCQTAPCASGLQCDATAHTCQPVPTKGQACTFQCASGLECDQTSHTCIDVPLVGAGQPCGIVQTQIVGCQSGLECKSSGTSGSTCVVPKNAGDACNVGKGECAVFLLCVNGTCQVPDYSVCK